jgi:group I intron endonuclease
MGTVRPGSIMRIVSSIRIEEDLKSQLVKKFGSFQLAFDSAIDESRRNKFYIYKITNVINNKCYIGVSVNPIRRVQEHRCVSNSHKLQDDIKEHGKDSFIVTILASTEDRKLAILVEDYLIDQFNAQEGGYNTMRIAGKNRKKSDYPNPVRILRAVDISKSDEKKILRKGTSPQMIIDKWLKNN